MGGHGSGDRGPGREGAARKAVGAGDFRRATAAHADSGEGREVKSASTASADALRGVRTYRERPEHWIVGLMTGTSADGMDAALVRFEGLGESTTHRLEADRESPPPAALRREILDVAGASSLP